MICHPGLITFSDFVRYCRIFKMCRGETERGTLPGMIVSSDPKQRNGESSRVCQTVRIFALAVNSFHGEQVCQNRPALLRCDQPAVFRRCGANEGIKYRMKRAERDE